MSIQHIVRCDVILPGGQRCESRREVKGQFDLPTGWHSIIAYQRPTAEDSLIAGPAFAPVVDVMKSAIVDEENEEKRAKNEARANQMLAQLQAASLEGMPNVACTGHMCDRHELPTIELKSHSPGCIGF